MAKFRVLIGKHREGGRTYVAGEVVDSKTDLSRLNSLGSHKFEKVEEEGGKSRAEITAPSVPRGAPPSPTSTGTAKVGPADAAERVPKGSEAETPAAKPTTGISNPGKK